MSKTETEDTDGDGDLADETPETTLNLVDHHNPTGYQQVLEEIDAATMAVIKSHVLGLDVISQQSPSIASGVPLFFLYDGRGSTRALLDPAGQILPGQVYAYDAYGNAHGFDPAATLTSLLYSGEQFDQKINMQYLRARYYDLATGRFNRLDPFAGNSSDPQSLHKYLYTHGDPVCRCDPTGLAEFTLVGRMAWAGMAMLGGLVTFGIGSCTYYNVYLPWTAFDLAMQGETVDAQTSARIAATMVQYWPMEPKMKMLSERLQGPYPTTKIVVIPASEFQEGLRIKVTNTLFVSENAQNDGAVAMAIVAFAEFQHTADGGGLSESDAQDEFVRIRNLLPQEVRTPYIDARRHGEMEE